MSDVDEGAPVPANRFREETRLKRQAQERVAELEQAISKLEQRVATTDLLSKQLEETRAKYTADATSWETERSVYQLGIVDSEAIEVARHLHGRLPEQGRPALADWLREAKADPAKAPKALQPYLAAPVAPAPGAQQAPAAPMTTATAQAAQRPGTTAPAAGQGRMDAAQIRQLREECARTGDWTRWREAQPAIRASLGSGV